MRPRVLWAGVEPTPYLVALQDRARQELPYEFHCVFERTKSSQDWEELPGPYRVLATDDATFSRMRLVARAARGVCQAVLLEGWGRSLLLALGVAAIAGGVPLIVSGDTHVAGSSGAWARPRRALRRFLLRRAAATLPGGSRQKAFFLAEGARPGGLVVRNMTVDVEFFADEAGRLKPRRAQIREAWGVSGRDFLALLVGRLASEKGVEVLLRSLTRAPGIHLLVVGAGPARSELESLALFLEITGRVHFAGRLGYREMPAAYAAADVLVVPSLREPWGLVVNEAMASGLPVIASDAVGCVDDLLASGAGVIVPAGDEAALAGALERLSQEPQRVAEMSLRAVSVIAGWTQRDEAAAVRRALELAGVV